MTVMAGLAWAAGAVCPMGGSFTSSPCWTRLWETRLRNSWLPVSPPSPSRWLGMSWSAGLALGAWETVGGPILGVVGFVVVTGGSPGPLGVAAPPPPVSVVVGGPVPPADFASAAAFSSDMHFMNFSTTMSWSFPETKNTKTQTLI